MYQDLVRQMAAIDETKEPFQREIEEASAALDKIKAEAERASTEQERAVSESAKAEHNVRRADEERGTVQKKMAAVTQRLEGLNRELQVCAHPRPPPSAGARHGLTEPSCPGPWVSWAVRRR